MTAKKKIIIANIVFVALFIVFCIVYFVFNQPDSKKSSQKSADTSTTNVYTDPGSGEKISNPSGKAPESYNNTSESSIAYLGFSNLLNIGVTNTQLTFLRSYFAEYALQQKKPYHEISIVLTSLQQTIDEGSGKKTLSFVVVFDRTTKVDAVVIYYSINDVILNLYNQIDKSQLYTSIKAG